MSTINILYFASFREALQIEKETFTLNDNIQTITDLKTALAQRQNQWATVFEPRNSVLVSINQTIAKNHSVITSNDEIAFFPPVTGG